MTFRSIFRQDLFAGHSIVVAGGGSGIGRCTAHELAALGARVALVGRPPEKLDTVRKEVGGDVVTAHHGGAIVNIIADMWHGMPGMGHSGAARAGMFNFTETAACE